MTTPRLLLHLCCGPCGTAVLERLARDFDVTLYWFNPNIQPADEYSLRLQAARQLAGAVSVELVVEDGAEEDFARLTEGWEDSPEGGERCLRCYEMRLRHAMAYAREHGHTHVAATLSISPHKSADDINAIGLRLAAEYGLTFLAEDFKQDGGFPRSVELSRQYGLYRQKYCGCLYSRR